MIPPEKNTILFTLVYKNEEYRVQTGRNQYPSLMSLISDRLAILGFGLCCGMGSCGTCMVEICDGNAPSGWNTLSCDIAINDDLANTRILIPEGYF